MTAARPGPTPTGERAQHAPPHAPARVLDLSEGIAGAYCTKLFADAGADVITVEPPGGGPLRSRSAARAAGAPGAPGPDEDGALYRYLATSKRGMVLAPDTADHRARLDDLAAGADILVEDLGPDRRTARGIDLGELRARHPDLVIVSISPFGEGGPWADRAANEFTLQAMSASMVKRGDPDREPLQVGGDTGLWLAGAFAALGGMAAWRGVRHGHGDLVSVSTLECLVIAYTVYRTLWQEMAASTGSAMAARDDRGPEIPSIEPARDGLVGFCTVLGRMWHDFCAMTGHDEWATDPALARWGGRAQRADELRAGIAAWLADRDVDEVVELANLLRIPCVPIGNGANVVGMEHFVARGVFVDNPAGFVQPRPPYRLSGTGHRPLGPAPALGEHDGELTGGEGRNAARGAVDGAAGGGPLAGLRVADFSGAIAGAYGAQILAMLGADVVKVESVTRPDPARNGSLLPMDRDGWWEQCPLYLAANTGKQGITLDLADPRGLTLARELVAGCDVVLENNTPRVMEGFGLDWAGVREINPRAVYARLPAFGLDGPWRDRTGFAQTQEQVTGLAYLTGYRDEGSAPVIPQGLCDWLSGAHAAFAVLVALDHRERTGEGTQIEATMTEVALNVAAEAIVEHSAYGFLMERQGNRSRWAAPQGVYPCAGEDAWIALSVPDDAAWAALVRALGSPDWATDPELSDEGGRRAAHDLLDDKLAAYTSRRPAAAIAELLVAHGVPAAPVARAADLADNPQLAARGFLETVDHPVVGTHHTYLGLPFRLASVPGPWNTTPAPTLGRDNTAVLGGRLGVSPARLAELARDGVIGTRPRAAAR